MDSLPLLAGLGNGDSHSSIGDDDNMEQGQAERAFRPLEPGSRAFNAAQPCLRHSGCRREGSQLLLAASFDLNALAPLGPDLMGCPSSALPPNAVILELAGAGFFAIPMGTPLPVQPLAGAKVNMLTTWVLTCAGRRPCSRHECLCIDLV